MNNTSVREKVYEDLMDWHVEKKLRYRSKDSFRNSQDHAFYQNLFRSIIRHNRKWEYIANTLLKGGVKKNETALVALITIGLAQIEDLQMQQHAAVYETVALAKKINCHRFCGIINAVLRRYLREQNEWKKRFEDLPIAIQSSHPDWLAQNWNLTYGAQQSKEIMQANNILPQVQIIIHPKYKKETLLDLQKQQITVEPLEGSLSGFHVINPENLFSSPVFMKGNMIVQDLSSQKFCVESSKYIQGNFLDLCGAPGGKSIHLHWLKEDEIRHHTITDSSLKRLEILRNNLQRTGCQAKVMQILPDEEPHWDEQMDVALVDAPCSSTGVIRRHPEIKWKIQPADMISLRQKQVSLLVKAGKSLKKGGNLIYATCSIQQDENHKTVTQFLEQQNGSFSLVPWNPNEAQADFFMQFPNSQQMGLFGAVLKKTGPEI